MKKVKAEHIPDAYVVAVKVPDAWIAVVGNTQMICDWFDIRVPHDEELVPQLCMDSMMGDATECKRMTLQELDDFEKRIQDSGERIVVR